MEKLLPKHLPDICEQDHAAKDAIFRLIGSACRALDHDKAVKIIRPWLLPLI